MRLTYHSSQSLDKARNCNDNYPHSKFPLEFNLFDMIYVRQDRQLTSLAPGKSRPYRLAILIKDAGYIGTYYPSLRPKGQLHT